MNRMNFKSQNNVKQINEKKVSINMENQYCIDKKMSTIYLFNQWNTESLISVMEQYTRNLRQTVNECQTKPWLAEKIKDFMSGNLKYFFFYYKMMKENCDRTAYLDIMSDLLSMYIDMEVKAPEIATKNSNKKSDQLTNYLSIYLENSTEHLLDTILKVQILDPTCYGLLDSLIATVLRIVPGHPKVGTMYVRYFLVYRLWMNINDKPVDKNNIFKKAQLSLTNDVPSIADYLKDNVLPKVPNQQLMTTELLFKLDFNLIKSCEFFFKYLKKNLDCPANVKPEDINNAQKMKNLNINTKNSDSKNSAPNNKINPLANSNNSNPVDISKNIKVNPNKKKLSLAPGQVLLVDLTSDKASGRIVREKGQLNKKKLSWMQKVGKKIDNNIKITNEDKKNSTINEDLNVLERAFDIKPFNLNDETIKKSINEDFNLWLGDILKDKMNKTEIPNKTTEKITEMNKLNMEKNKIIHSNETEIIIDNKITKENEINIENNKPIKENKLNIKNSISNMKENNEINSENKINYQSVIIEVPSNPRTKPEKSNLLIDKRIIIQPPDVISSIKKLQKNINQELEITTSKIQEISVDSIDKNNKNNYLNKNILEPVSTNNKKTDQHKRQTVLHLNHQQDKKPNDQDYNNKFIENEFNDTIDGLSLLASVSERVLDLTTSRSTPDYHETTIKVKNLSNLIVENSNLSVENLLYSDDGKKMNYSLEKSMDKIEKSLKSGDEMMEIYPDDDIDRVALHIEVSSSEDPFDQCTSTVYQPDENSTSTSDDTPSTSDQYQQNEKDETNVILSGETVVLLQKSPNSNLYIINKATENHDNLDDNLLSIDKKDNTSLEKNVDDKGYSYDIYRRPGDKIMSNEILSRTSVDLKKSRKEVIKSPRKHHIKQEYNNLNCVVTQQDHKNSQKKIYHAGYSTNDIYYSCHGNNCSTIVPCSLSVSHQQTSQYQNINCPYDVYQHCNDSRYLYPMQQQQIINEIKNEKLTYNNSKYNEIENEKINFNNIDIDNKKYKNDNYDINNEYNYHLPPKKRFNFGNKLNNDINNIKNDKNLNSNNNYTSEPMISIAELTNNNKNEQLIRGNYHDNVKSNHKISENNNNCKKKRCNDGQLSRPSKKVKETIITPINNKNLKRQTRSSQRKVPKVNYCFDGDTEWKSTNQPTRKKRKN